MKLKIDRTNYPFKHRFTSSNGTYGFIASEHHGSYSFGSGNYTGYSTLKNTLRVPNKNKTFYV